MDNKEYCQEEVDNQYNDFAKKIKKVNGPRQHKVKNSWGVYDAYKYYTKNKPKEKKYVLSESEYFAIIRNINKHLAELLSKGEDVILPYRLGKLEIRKHTNKVSIDKETNRIKTSFPIDWKKTLKLWFEDKECLEKKILVRSEDKELFKINYNKSTSKYINKSFYQFTINREIKQMLKQNIKRGIIDAFNMY